MGAATGAAGAMFWGAVAAGVSASSAGLAGQAIKSAAWRGAGPGALLGGISHGALPSVESWGLGGHLALSKPEAKKLDSVLSCGNGAEWEALKKHAKSNTGPTIDELAMIAELEETPGSSSQEVNIIGGLNNSEKTLASQIRNIPKPFRAKALAFLTNVERTQPTSAAKTLKIAKHQWHALFSALLDPVETATTSGKLFFGTSQTGVISFERAAITALAKSKVD